MWILKNVILIDTYMSHGKSSGKVLSVHKGSMEDSELFANFTHKNTPTYFSKSGIQFLSMEQCAKSETLNTLWLRHVSMEHDPSRDQRYHVWDTEVEGDFAGDQDCCYSFKVGDVRRRDFAHNYLFSSDGTLAILEGDTCLSAFDITGCAEANQKPRSVWRFDYDRSDFSGKMLTNSIFLVLMGNYVAGDIWVNRGNGRTKYTLVNLENGELVKSFDIVNHANPEWIAYYHEITSKHLLVFHLGCACPRDGCDCGFFDDEVNDGILRLVDLDTCQERRTPLKGLQFENTISHQHLPDLSTLKNAIFKFTTNKDLAIFLDDDGATLISPTSIKDQDLANQTRSMTGDMAVKFQEVTDGLFVVTTESRTLLYQEESAYNSVYWNFQLVFLKGERLSAALQKWVELFSEPNSPKYLIPKGGFFA